MIIQVKDLVAGYEHKVLIRNLFFSVPEPAFVAIIGHNGSGKTTFFKAFTGSIPYSGQIFINKTDLKTIANPSAEGLYSYLPQRNVISFPVSVIDLVVMGVFRKKKFFENYYTAEAKGNAVVTVALKDSIRRVTDAGNVAENRADFRLVQTPQCFTTALLRQAYALPEEPTFTDDASVVEKLGEKINLTEGSYLNLKITTPEDLVLAEALLKASV